ncbi:MAG TPA: carboxypeptidase-like regulatory domain-containing protein, partial [Planctomycetota bacterium]|nr:carboxypeptidase-like regulatory domain-containing protein [Planctomycetota bacterium]
TARGGGPAATTAPTLFQSPATAPAPATDASTTATPRDPASTDDATTPEAATAEATPAHSRLFGRVFAGDRNPGAGARVRLLLPDGQTLETGASEDGSYRFDPPRVRARGRTRLHIVATDASGRVGWSTPTMGFPDAESPTSWVVPGMGGLDIVLREPCAARVRVVAGGVPVEGAIVRAETEEAIPAKSADLRTGADGTVLLESFPAGAWTVFARAPGRGRGKARVRLPHPGEDPVEVAISSRSIEVEVVTAGSGKPVEGATVHVWEEWFRSSGEPILMPDFSNPMRSPPTDSSGRTRIEGISADEPIEVLPVPPGESRPTPGTLPVRVEPGTAAVRLELASSRRVRWPLVAGERAVPPEGTEVRIVEASTLRMMEFGLGERFTGRVVGAEIVAEGFGHRALAFVAVAPDGSLARLRAAAGADRGEPTSFSDPKTLEVAVRDEDGTPVADSIVMLKDEEGHPLATMETPDAAGVTRFEGLPAGTVVVCALAHWDYGGAEVARVRLAEPAGRVEVVVGRPIPVRVRVRIGGKPRLPGKFELVVRYPGPAPFEDLCHEQIRDAKEDPERAEAHFKVRPHAPGKPVRLELRVPGRANMGADVRPVDGGGEALVEFDLSAE